MAPALSTALSTWAARCRADVFAHAEGIIHRHDITPPQAALLTTALAGLRAQLAVDDRLLAPGGPCTMLLGEH